MHAPSFAPGEFVRKSYIPEFDGLRALAAIAVVLGHSALELSWIREARLHVIAVRLFFVLSGFLITSILLGMKGRVEERHSNVGSELKTFYIRRALRIFPPYFAFLFFFLAIGNVFVRKTFLWHAAYLSNVYAAFVQPLESPVAHFWTLAVEEQFYLVWPLLLLCVPRRWLSRVLLAAVAFAVGYRFVTTTLGENPGVRALLPFACLDSLGIGSLLAVYFSAPERWAKEIATLRWIGLWIGLPGMLITILLANPAIGFQRLFGALGILSISLFSASLLLEYLRPNKGFGSRVLQSGPLVYLGKISYGIYIYHFPLLDLCGYLVKKGWLGRSPAIHFVFVLSSVILVASLSWFLLESPLRNLKRYFRYSSAAESVDRGPVLNITS